MLDREHATGLSPCSCGARLSSVEAWLGCGWLVVMAVLEIAGQRFTSDFADAAALLGVSLLVYMTKMVHRRRNLWFVTSIGMGLRRVSHAFWLSTVEIGVDLTRSPPLPRGIPLKWPLLLVILTLLVSGLIMVAPAFPSATRTVLAAHFYLGCLVLEGLLWLGLAFGILVHSFLAWARLHDWLVERHHDQQRRSIRTEVRATAAMFATLIGAAAALPLWIPLAVHAFFLVTACAALLASSPGLELLWRYRGGGSVRVFDGRWLVWMTCVGSGLFAIALILIAGGESLWEGPFFLLLKAAPMTTLLGRHVRLDLDSWELRRRVLRSTLRRIGNHVSRAPIWECSRTSNSARKPSLRNSESTRDCSSPPSAVSTGGPAAGDSWNGPLDRAAALVHSGTIAG